MFERIDYKATITKSKLTLKKGWFSKLFDNIFWITMIIAFPVISLSMLYGSIKFNWINDSLPQIIISQIIAFSISIFLIVRLSRLDNLKVIQGQFDTNRIWVKEIFKKFEFGQFIDNKYYSIAVLKPGLLAWHRYVYVIYKNNDILINCTTYGIHGIKSPFHRIVDRKIENKILKEIKLKSTTAQQTV